MEDELGLRLEGVLADAAAVNGSHSGRRGGCCCGRRCRCPLPARTGTSLGVLLEVGLGGKIASAAPDATEHAAGNVVTPLVEVPPVLKSKYLNQREGSDARYVQLTSTI